MNYHIAICDDEKEQALALAKTVALWAKENLHHVDTSIFASSESFLFECAEENHFDILLLDVEMDKINGIELAKRLRQRDCRAEIIFVTSHPEFIGEGYEVDALHYLLKPVSQEKLFEVLTRAAQKLSVAPPSIPVTCDGGLVRLREDEIVYAESFLHYIIIHTTSGDYRVKQSLGSFVSGLSAGFFRIHRSYVISLVRIVQISRNSVTLEGGVTLPLARGLYDSLNRAFIEYL